MSSNTPVVTVTEVSDSDTEQDNETKPESAGNSAELSHDQDPNWLHHLKRELYTWRKDIGESEGFTVQAVSEISAAVEGYFGKQKVVEEMKAAWLSQSGVPLSSHPKLSYVPYEEWTKSIGGLGQTKLLRFRMLQEDLDVRLETDLEVDWPLSTRSWAVEGTGRPWTRVDRKEGNEQSDWSLTAFDWDCGVVKTVGDGDERPDTEEDPYGIVPGMARLRGLGRRW